ncbi:hypothetical protein [Streptomyces sp. SP18CS02]|uniref:hypothetical protein n=1 Tax=Streptomyces sp. SP18CS02 TaxID=3002531 RepID=UPI002E77F515|nr:hypothetical protein [Streptomyces sp. SP18CS02]MEE1756177.1 hypothetical protein [Streptomyces sp. SP18CS02]
MDGDRTSTLPGAHGVRSYVAGFVARLTERHRLPLDYTAASLRLVDLVVDGLRRDQPERTRIEPVLWGLGAYTGEVMVRRVGGRWIDFDAGQRALFGQPVGIRMPDGRYWNPVGKVINRFEDGSEESVQRFYLTLHGRVGRRALL